MNGLRCVAVAVTTFLAFNAPALAEKVYNVKTFGAKGDGVTDDSTAITNALSAAAHNPGTVLFPPGRYLYSTNLVAFGVPVVGQNATLLSKNNANLRLSGNSAVCREMNFSSQSSSDFALVVSNAKNFSIIKNSFDTTIKVDIAGNNSTNGRINSNTLNLPPAGTGIEFAQSPNISIENNTINGGAIGIAFAGAKNITVTENHIQHAATAVQLSLVNTARISQNTISDFADIGTETSQCVDLTISNNSLSDPTQTSALAVIISSQDSQSVISGNNIQNARQGILTESDSNVQVKNNTVSNISQVAVTVFSTNRITVSGNQISDAAQAIILNGNTNSTVTSNHIARCQASGIVAEFGLGQEVITHNDLLNCGLNVQGPPTAVIFVESPDASQIPIVGNSYEGNTKGLAYFIWCQQPEPPAIIEGNVTHTTLPNRIGS